LGRLAIECLADGPGQLLRAPERAVGNIDVDRKAFVELVVEHRTKRGKDTLEGFNTTAKVEPLLTLLKEALLDLRIFLSR